MGILDNFQKKPMRDPADFVGKDYRSPQGEFRCPRCGNTQKLVPFPKIGERFSFICSKCGLGGEFIRKD